MEKMNTKSRFRSITSSKYFSFGITVLLFLILYAIGMVNYPGFTKPQVFMNLFIDNAPLIITTIGISFVLLVGGMDISIGFVQGYLITRFKMQPFIVTLAGQFFGRGLTAVISRDTIEITNETFVKISAIRVPIFGKNFISVGSVIAILVLIIATFVLKYTKFGRNLYALGGNEQSASLMGLPTNRTKISAYSERILCRSRWCCLLFCLCYRVTLYMQRECRWMPFLLPLLEEHF